MATIEQFNEAIERAKTKADFSAVVWMKRTDAQVGVTSIQKRKNQLFVFRQVIAWKDTDHAAIIANGHVMAIWHRDSSAQPAPDSVAAGDAPAEEYTQDEERTRLLARIRELEEALETIYEMVNERLGDKSADYVRWRYRDFEIRGKIYLALNPNEALAEPVKEA